MRIKHLITLLVISFFFSSSQAFARKPTVSSLNYAINKLKKENTYLNKQLRVQKVTLEKQGLSLNAILEKQALLNEQTDQQMEQLRFELNGLKSKEEPKQDNSLLYLLSALTAFALGLALLSLLLQRRNRPRTDKINTRIESVESGMSKLSGQSVHHAHELSTLVATHGELFKGFGAKLSKLDSERKLSHERRKAVEKELKVLLANPVTYEATDADGLLINTLIEEDNLNFEEILQAKSLGAEYKGQWLLAIVYWETLLAENKNNTLALLHIAYGNYKLAERHRKDEIYLEKASATYHQIMQLAPEYFEDIYAYDSDENMGASELVNDPDKVFIYQQIEQLVLKVDELKNYQSIYDLACQYAKEGSVQDAQTWLEQIAVDSGSLHCQHLLEDKDLDALRELPWFQRLLREACE